MIWMLAVGQAIPKASTQHPWALSLAYVAAIVFLVIVLAGAYLIQLALRQRNGMMRRDPPAMVSSDDQG